MNDRQDRNAPQEKNAKGQSEWATQSSEKTASEFAESASRVKTRRREHVTKRCVRDSRCSSGTLKRSNTRLNAGQTWHHA
jgi:hypothetical protein